MRPRARALPLYGILTVAILLFSISMLLSLHRIRGAHELEVKVTASSFWTAAQADYEIQRLLNGLDLFVLGDGQVSREELHDRFVIFWSRLPALAEGEADESLLNDADAGALVPELMARLEALEPKIATLLPDDRAGYAELRAELVALAEPLRTLFERIFQAHRDRLEQRQGDLISLYAEHLGYQLGILLSTAVFIGCLVRSLRKARRAEAAAHAAEAQLRAVIDAVPAKISAVDRQARYVFVNRYHAERSGAAAPAAGVADAEETAALATWLAQPQERPASCEEQKADRFGLERTWLTTRVPVIGADGQVSQVVTVSLDITERKQAEARIRHLAHHDALTDLPNRLLFREHLDRLLLLSRRRRETIAVHCLDLDNFKDINDTMGHAAGDALLVELARRLERAIRTSDTIARLGGDEFAVIQNDVGDAAAAERLAAKLHAALAPPFRIEEQEVLTTASIGIALGPRDGGDAEQLLKAADLALYAAKGAGRNTCRFFDAAMTDRILQRQTLQSELRAALQQGALELHYQPKLRLADRRIDGVEALLRWQHPERGWISPAQFIPIAEDSGLIGPIGALVVDAACAQAKAWLDAGLPQRVAINLSAAQFERDDLVGLITDALAAHDLPTSYLEIEITESALLRQTEQVLATLQALRALGLCITLDDFGTGYSSLSYLQRFPIDQIKIDRSFVQAIDVARQSSPIIKAIIAMAHSLDLTVVAEGVETERQLDCLVALRCDEVQGYLIGKPQPAAELQLLLAGLAGPQAPARADAVGA
jgi:diguanylate cyclase (GGDEF)-like protein